MSNEKSIQKLAQELDREGYHIQLPSTMLYVRKIGGSDVQDENVHCVDGRGGAFLKTSAFLDDLVAWFEKRGIDPVVVKNREDSLDVDFEELVEDPRRVAVVVFDDTIAISYVHEELDFPMGLE